MNFELKKHIELRLSEKLGIGNSFKWKPVAGGSINETYKITSKSISFFVKINTTNVFENGFDEEVSGIQFLKVNSTLVPQIICNGVFKEYAYLVLEWIVSGIQTETFWTNFTQQLVKLHKQKSDRFGLKTNNYMGELVQNNTLKYNFSEFFIENRLKPQIKIAFNNRLLQPKILHHFENLFKQLEAIIPKENPAALHGDLWSGNFICNSNEQVVLIDPAVYYGHREIDIAMTTLFGGFSSIFYENYNETYPLEKGFENRKDIYNLYPLLIHLNLFGSSYFKSIETIITKF
jgi:fructosamine-3-kinase